MQMVSRVVAFPKLRRMTWITHCSIKIEDTVERAAGANPFVDCLANRLSVSGEVISALIWCQRGPDYPYLMFVRAVYDLTQTHNQFFRGDFLSGKRAFFSWWSIFRRRGFHMWPADIIDAFEHNQSGHPGLCEHIPIKPSQRIYAGPIMQNAVSSNSLVYHR